jgi:hypothetical protein
LKENIPNIKASVDNVAFNKVRKVLRLNWEKVWNIRKYLRVEKLKIGKEKK